MIKPHFILRSGILALTGLLLASCMLLESEGPKAAEHDGPRGLARFELELERSQDQLLKAAVADTTFDLDSLLIVLAAPGVATTTYRYPLTGRADLGDIVVPAKTLSLLGLRTWKAKILSIDIDETLTRDTVHIDSVSFAVNTTDTTVINRSISPAFSILRARFISSSEDSVITPVRYVRLKVNGATRDSARLGARNASLNWIQAVGGSTIFAAGDSGRVLTSTDDGANWSEQSKGTRPMVGGSMVSASVGYVMSDLGTIYRTDDGGNAWQQRNTMPNGADTMRAIHFVPGGAYGFVIGRNGIIYKTVDGWQQWQLVSNTSYNLNGIHFPNTTTGYIVGENETILKTTNGDVSGGTPVGSGGIVWAPVAGGWFNQTSGLSDNLTGMHFTSATRGWVVGKGGALLLTTNGGASWASFGGLGGLDANALWMTPDPGIGYAVGAGGVIRRMTNNENYWAPLASPGGSGTTQELFDVRMVGMDTGWAVGANGTLLRTINGTAGDNVTRFSSQVGWSPQTGAVGNWIHLYGVSFSGIDTGWAVGVNGAIQRTTNRGNTWSSQNNGSAQFNDVWAFNGRIGIAAGNGGAMRRTVDGGANWPLVTNGVAGGDIRAMVFAGQIGWYVGASNAIRSTNDSGKSWTSRDQTGNWYGVAKSPSRVWVVGASGAVRRSNNDNQNANFNQVVGNTGLTSYQLNGVAFPTDDTGWVVGSSGFIARTVNGNTSTQGNVTWTQQGNSPQVTTQTLRHVSFVNQTTGYITGDNGVILKTTNAGGEWKVLSSGTTENLQSIHLASAQALYIVGMGQTILRTLDAGYSTTQPFRSVFPFTSTTVYVAGGGGIIRKSTDGGENWTDQVSPNSKAINSLWFRTASLGLAVGDTGLILKTVDGGANWTTRTSPVAKTLNSVRFVTADTVYATGKDGLVIKSTNAGESWYTQETPPNARNLNNVFAFNKDLVFAVGDSGRILKAVNEGDNWSGGGDKKSLKGVYFPTVATGYIVGAQGTIIKTTNGGEFWKKQTSGLTETLYGVYFTDSLTGWVAGEGGKVLKTTNGGTNWTPQTSNSGVTLRWANFRNANRGFLIGGTQSLVNTTNGGANWGSQFVGAPGIRTFDELLAYKRLRPDQSHTIVLQAIDQETPLRGFQATKTVIVAAGKDSTIVTPMTRCGYGVPTPACTP